MILVTDIERSAVYPHRVVAYYDGDSRYRIQWVRCKENGHDYPWRVYRNGVLCREILFNQHGMPCGYKEVK